MVELHEAMGCMIQQKKHKLVLNVNVHCLNLTVQQPWLKNFLNSADIVFCDGAGVMLGAKLLGETIPERITYADWFWQLAEWCTVNEHSLYFLEPNQASPKRPLRSSRTAILSYGLQDVTMAILTRLQRVARTRRLSGK
ncbi:MAG: WecB/TagA/CpsF family glycosyltransferase [Chloroflexota bacterium]